MSNPLSTSLKVKRQGSAKLVGLAILLLVVTAGLASVLLNKTQSKQVVGADAITYRVFQGEFVSSVNESGDIESSSNVEIRCEVKSQGKAGTAIIEIVPEGSRVQAGEFICQLDDSLLQDDLTKQRIAVAEDKAKVIQAESDLDTANRVQQEFKNGTYQQQLDSLKAEVAFALETKRRAFEYRDYSQVLSSKGYITRTQFEADTFAATKAELDLKLAEQELSVFQEHTKSRMLAEFDAEIRKQKANVIAAEYTLELSERREKEIAAQIAACRMVAPSSGMVVYANETDRRGESSFVIEEGALIRDGQPIVRLPDPTQMQIRTKVNDSKINMVEVGQPVLIRVDTDPEKPVRGKVRKVSDFPMPRRWYQAPIEYEVFVDVTEDSELIRPGLRGKAEIFVQRIADVCQSPLSCLVRKDDRFFVIVRDDAGQLQPRQVEIGLNNEQFVIIKSGVEVGVDVLVDPENYIDDIEFPSAEAKSNGSGKSGEVTP